jgi:hypothetical protein
MGCRVRIRLKAIWRLISREVPRRARRKLVGALRRTSGRFFKRFSSRVERCNVVL